MSSSESIFNKGLQLDDQQIEIYRQMLQNNIEQAISLYENVTKHEVTEIVLVNGKIELMMIKVPHVGL